jgi:ribosomal protein S12 methylthiotransferase
VTTSRLVSLVHFGCARNLIDSELILGRLAEEGLVVTGDPDAADAVVINTCSFIDLAREESEGGIRAFLDKKARGELGAVIVAGCLVQRYKRGLRERYPDVDLFAEISDYRELARSVRGILEGRRIPRYLEAGGLRDGGREGARLLATPRSYAYLRISHGCDHTCSFCAIPAIRGPHRSKRLPAVLAEAEELVSCGVRELVLVAEDSTAWGREMGLELPDLVEALADLDGVHRVRVMYAFPNRFPWRLTELLRDHPRVATYLDIPVQHASTPILRAMRRAGSGEQVRRILDRLFEEVPGITVRSTFLLGFPGETDADAEAVVKLVEDYGLSRLGVFLYSHEEGTLAHELAHDVPESVARERYDAVTAARDRNIEKGQRAAVGSEVEVLVDELWPDRGLAVARGDADAPEADLGVRVHGLTAEVGDVVRARIESVAEDGFLVGRC